MIRLCRTLGAFGALTLALAAASASCTGQLGEPRDRAGDGPPTGTDGQPLQCEGITPGPSPIRRLTRREYDATVSDLLGTSLKPGSDFPPDQESQGFNNNAGLLGVSQILSDRYLDAAEALSLEAIADLDKLLPCDRATDSDAACARAFILSFGQRAFRRPLKPSEVDRFLALYASGEARGGLQKGVDLVIRAALISPFFLYRVEIGAPPPPDASGGDDGDKVVKLDPYEVATRLSYLLWGSMPDDALFAAAAAGKLASPDGVAAEARRMLDTPRTRAMVADFHAQWLEIDGVGEMTKDQALYPQFNEHIGALMQEETRRFVEDVLFEGDGRVETLLTADYSMMNKELADFYGVSGPTGDAFERVELDATRSAGILTQASFTSVHAHNNQTSPVERGKVIRERFFCEALPPPPPDLVIMPPEIEEGVTTREKFRQHSDDPACVGCHKLMDPIGLGFERYDAIGRFRDQQYGLPVDASGEVSPASGREDDASTGAFDGVGELAGRLAESEAVRSCLITQWFRYGYGRSETKDDACTLDELQRTFDAKGHDVREILIALTQTEAFLYRRASTTDGTTEGTPAGGSK